MHQQPHRTTKARPWGLARRSASHIAWAGALACLLLGTTRAQPLDLPEPRNIAPGVLLYHVDTPALVDPPGPLSMWMLRLDRTRIDLQAVLANDEIMGVETVGDIAARHKPVAAINAGFFLPNGDPAGVMTIDGRLVSDTRRPRGAVGISSDKTGVKLVFARLKATASLVLQNKTPPSNDGSAMATVPIDGIDTTRLRGQLMLFTPSYHADTDTAKGGLEWVDRSSARPPRQRPAPRRRRRAFRRAATCSRSAARSFRSRCSCSAEARASGWTSPLRAGRG